MPTDPFLCSECQTLGYCKNARSQQTAALHSIVAGMPKAVLYWVPLKARKNNGNLKFHKKVQQAHDLFHQAEYEGASYLYRHLFDNRNDSSEVLIGLISSLYFLKQYSEAASLATKLEKSFDSFPDNFINHCIEQEVAKEKSNEEELTEMNEMTLHTCSIR